MNLLLDFTFHRALFLYWIENSRIFVRIRRQLICALFVLILNLREACWCQVVTYRMCDEAR